MSNFDHLSLSSESTKSTSETSSSESIIDIGELSWSQRLRPKPKLHGKYLRGDILGQGTFAKVYEVLDTFSLERRAVKVFDLRKIDRKFNRDEMIKMINQEVTLLAGCHHPNVIKLVDLQRTLPVNHDEKEKEKAKKQSDTKNSNKKHSKKDQKPPDTSYKFKKKNKIWMYIEYCMASVAELMELSNPVNSKSLPRIQARHYFIGLMNGLEYLHSKGIYHKDIKPDNMLIDVLDTVKLTDLSVSYVVDIFAQSDTCFNTYGTIAYQSPEVINSNDSGYSASALDIWSAGVTLYVMITAKFPFPAANGFLAMTESIMKDEPLSDEVLTKDISLSSLIGSMLTKDPARRIKLHKILKHPWLRVNLPIDKRIVPIPPRYANGDQYRSLTITSYLHELHYPLSNEQNIVTVSEVSADEFNAKRKIPILRSNRSPGRRRRRRRKLSFIDRVTSGQTGRLLGVMGLQPKSLNIYSDHSSSTDDLSGHSNLSNISIFSASQLLSNS